MDILPKIVCHCPEIGTQLLYQHEKRQFKRNKNSVLKMDNIQCRMARAALGWGVRDLAAAAKVATDTVARFERGEELKERTVEAIQAALEAAGVVFLADGETVDGGPGVRLRPRH